MNEKSNVSLAEPGGATYFVDFVDFSSRLVCTRQDKPRDSVNERDLMEVEQKPQWHVQQFHLS